MTKGATMVKRGRSKDGVNKAALVREAFKKLGLDAAAKEVQEFAEAQGATVAPAQISNIRTKLKGKAAGKARKSSGEKGGNGGMVTANELVQARNMAEKVGGVERAKELLDILNRLR